MANDIANNYAAQIAEMRQHRNATEQRERLSVIEDNYKVATEMRDEAAEEGNTEEWNNADKWAEELETEYAKLAPPPQPSYVNEENAAFVARCAGDLSNPVNNLRFEQAVATAQRAGINLSDPAQFKEAIDKFYSPGVFNQQGQLIPGTAGPVIPQNYEPPPDLNEMYETLRKTSKYGKDLKPDEYIRGEHERDKRNSLGYYRNK